MRIAYIAPYQGPGLMDVGLVDRTSRSPAT